jgi:glutamine amidotransferase
MNIAIIDAGAGNLKSIYNFFFRNFSSTIKVYSSQNKDLDESEVLILPGVGHFGHVSKNLKDTNLDESIKMFASTKKPLIGICLGAQILTKSSEEALETNGLGLINANCISLSKHPTYRGNIPRIGWSGIEGEDKSSYYFVHSFFINVNDKNLATKFCVDGVTASVQFDNILATQFHPEKSDLSGESFIKEFLKKYV